MRIKWILALTIMAFAEGIGLTGWLKWFALYVEKREVALAFRWAEDTWFPRLMMLARLGENDPLMIGVAGICIAGIVALVGATSAKPSHAFSWFLRPAGLWLPALTYSFWAMKATIAEPVSKWFLLILPACLLMLELNPLLHPPVKRRIGTLIPIVIALGALSFLLWTSVRNLNVLTYFYSFQTLTNSLAIAGVAGFAGIFLTIGYFQASEEEPHLAPSLASLLILPIGLVLVTHLAPPPFLVKSARVQPIPREAGEEYLQYLWAGRSAEDLPIAFEYSYRVPSLEEVAKQVKIPENASALDFDRSFYQAMDDLLRLPLHTRTVREWIFPWIQYRVRHPCEPVLSTFEKLIAHDPNLSPLEVTVYRASTKACETASADQSYRAIVLLLAHGYVEEAQDEANALFGKIRKANAFLAADREIDEADFRRRVEEVQAYFGEDSRKTGGITGRVIVDEGALKPGMGIAAAVKVGVSLLYPEGLPFRPASAFTGYVEPDANGAFRLLDLPIRDYIIIVALRKDLFQADVSVQVNRPLIRLTSEKYEVRDLEIRISPNGDFFKSIETKSRRALRLSQDAVKEITAE